MKSKATLSRNNFGRNSEVKNVKLQKWRRKKPLLISHFFLRRWNIFFIFLLLLLRSLYFEDRERGRGRQREREGGRKRERERRRQREKEREKERRRQRKREREKGREKRWHEKKEKRNEQKILLWAQNCSFILTTSVYVKKKNQFSH